MSKRNKKTIAQSDLRNPRHKAETWGSSSEYAELIRWLVPDVLRHGGWRVVAVMVLSVFSVAARGATIGAVVYYVRAQVDESAVVILGQSLPSDASVAAFALWGGAALAFALLDVAARSWADRINFDIAESYASVGFQHILQHVAAGGSFEPPEDMAVPNPLIGTLQLDGQLLIRAVVQALSLPTPLITFSVVAGVLLWINAVLTLVLLPLFGGYSLAVAAINRRMLRDSQRRISAVPQVRHDLLGIAYTLRHTRFPWGGLPGWLRDFPRKTWLERSIRAYRGMWFARRRVQYLREGFNGIALLTIVMVFGSVIANDSASWSIVLTYLVALGYGIQSMDKFSRLVTAANRRVPHVRRYVWFMQTHGDRLVRTQAPAADTAVDTVTSIRLSASSESLAGSGEALELAPGSITYCAYDRELESGQMGELCSVIAGSDDRLATELQLRSFALARIGRLPERSVTAMLPPSLGDPAAVAGQFFDRAGVLGEFESRIGDVNAIITAELDGEASPALRCAIRLLPAVATDAFIAFIGDEALSGIDAAGRTKIMEAMSGQIVIVIPDDPSVALSPDAQDVIVVADDRLQGIGDRPWHEGLRSAGHFTTPKWLIDAGEVLQQKALSGADDDDFDDE